MKRFSTWALLVSGLLSVPTMAINAADEPAKSDSKTDANQVAELFRKMDKNGDGKITPDEVSDEQGRYFDRLVRIGDKDDNGELTKDEFEAALKRSDAPVQGGGLDRGGPGAGGRPMFEPKMMLERLDKNKDGKLTKDELPEEGPGQMLRRMLERTGKDSLNLEDLERARAMFGNGARPGGAFDPAEMIKRLDKNNDGKLSKDELPEPLRDRLSKVFEKLGKDELTGDEFRKAMTELGPMPVGPGSGAEGRQNLEEMFKRFDKNNDGKVTLEEVPEQFRDRVKPVFDRAGKEVLSLDDVRAFAQRGEGGPRPEGRKPEGDRPTEGRKLGGERGQRPEGEPRRDGDRRPEAGPSRDGERRRNGDRRPEDGPPRDGDRRPEGAPPRDGDRRPDGDGRRQPQGPLFFQILDRNHDGLISRNELDSLRELFKELDRNNDGQLDRAELLGPPPGDRGPNGPSPDGDRGPDEGRRPDGDRPPEGRGRPDGDRPPEGRGRADSDRKPEGDPRRPEADRAAGRPARRGDPEDRPRDDKPREGDKPRDSEKPSR